MAVFKTTKVQYRWGKCLKNTWKVIRPQSSCLQIVFVAVTTIAEARPRSHARPRFSWCIDSTQSIALLSVNKRLKPNLHPIPKQKHCFLAQIELLSWQLKRLSGILFTWTLQWNVTGERKFLRHAELPVGCSMQLRGIAEAILIL